MRSLPSTFHDLNRQLQLKECKKDKIKKIANSVRTVGGKLIVCSSWSLQIYRRDSGDLRKGLQKKSGEGRKVSLVDAVTFPRGTTVARVKGVPYPPPHLFHPVLSTSIPMTKGLSLGAADPTCLLWEAF